MQRMKQTCVAAAAVMTLAGALNAAETVKYYSTAELAKLKGVAWCSSYVVGAHNAMECSGDVDGKATPYDLLSAGWRVETDIGGANKFILVFRK